MPCFHPLHGYRAGSGGISFRKAGSTGLRMCVPCGGCIGCLLERSRQWGVRCMHEAALYNENCFVTLTYDDEHLPPGGSLDREAFPKFVRSLRKAGLFVRYFHCGEYGEVTERPHYHACLFGLDFKDKIPLTVRNGYPVFRSPFLESKWDKGFSEIGSLTFESAAYIARYCVKKLIKRIPKDSTPDAVRKASRRLYERVDPETGEIYEVEREYVTMSRRPGIGHGWYRRFGDEVYPSDEVIVRGKRARPPRYYDKLLEAAKPEVAEAVRRSRRRNRDRSEETPERLHVREVCTEARLNLLPRSV